MDIHISDQRILLFADKITPEDAEKTAWEKKTISFDTLSKVTSFLSRPKQDEFELIYKEHRFEPFWHVVAKARYVYDRSANYQIETQGKEVKKVTIQDVVYDVNNLHIHTAVTEHCIQDEEEDIYVDAVTGLVNPNLAWYANINANEVVDTLEDSIPKNSIIVPPQTRVSSLMRDALSKMIKGINADTILEEKVEVPCIDLYYHPIFAFKFLWKSKNKEAIVEVDGLSGEVRPGQRTFQEYIGKVLDKNFLFDVGADAAGMFIPGGSIAVKVAKKYIDHKNNSSKK